MVPYLAIIDSKFIKIFSMAHLKEYINKPSSDLENNVTEPNDTSDNVENLDDSALALVDVEDETKDALLTNNKVSLNSESLVSDDR